MLPFKPGDRVVELGGGDKPIFHPNIDIRQLPMVDIVADFTNGIPLGDGDFDGVFSSYNIEHISRRKVKAFIKEVHRILRPGGIAFFVTANLLEQCKAFAASDSIADQENWISAIFGDQNYEGDAWRANAHYCGFSPKLAIAMFREAGFSDVFTLPHPNCKTDLIIEARKPIMNEATKWTTEERKAAYNREYFDGGRGKVGGYAHEGYWDFPIHWFTAQKFLEQKPESVLELGAARGYVLKKIGDCGVRVHGLEVSDHCYHTRVIREITQWDVTQTPWPIPDNSYDLCISMAVMEHIPEDKLEAISKEISRTCKRALHGISFEDDAFDKTHVTLRTKEWWTKRLPPSQQVVDKEEFEKGPLVTPPDDGKLKLNIGSFTTMFYHGWLNMDIHPLESFANKFGYKFRQHDARKQLPFADGSVDMIYTCHFLEHLTHAEGSYFLSECARVMKPGAVLRIILPDAAKLIREYQLDKLGAYDEINGGCADNPYQIGKLWALLFSGHQSLYDEPTLLDALRKHSFSHVFKSDFRQSINAHIHCETLDMFPSLSLFVEAVK